MLFREWFYAGLVLALSVGAVSLAVGVLSVAECVALAAVCGGAFLWSVVFFEE